MIDWVTTRGRLIAPFAPADVKFRARSTPQDYKGRMCAPVVAYVDARVIQDRLDAVVGCEHWTFIPQVAATKDGAVTAALGTLTIYGVAKGDIGDCDRPRERSKTSVSDALKRAAVQWGIGRYLYDLPRMYANFQKQGDDWKLCEGEAERLRGKLPR